MKKNFFYVIGSNVSKSPSPTIFNHWFKKYSINANYKKLNVKENDLKKTIQNLKNNKDVLGFNITTPHKERVINFIFKEDISVKKIGATNCIYKKNKKLYGTNTDWIGYKNTILKITKPKERRKKVAAIIGYGGGRQGHNICAKRAGI